MRRQDREGRHLAGQHRQQQRERRQELARGRAGVHDAHLAPAGRRQAEQAGPLVQADDEVLDPQPGATVAVTATVAVAVAEQVGGCRRAGTGGSGGGR
ncbi:hypothetical protein GCM10020001_053070 [Nonomuraea salmonea]